MGFYEPINDGIIGERPDADKWTYNDMIINTARKLKIGKKYKITHRSYISGQLGEKAGRTVTDTGVLLTKYPHGALFRIRHWNEFFTWPEITGSKEE